MFKSANGRPTRILAGLHFAGEGSGDPNEHAVACYARSVFEKLEISPTPSAVPVDRARLRPRFSRPARGDPNPDCRGDAEGLQA